MGTEVVSKKEMICISCPVGCMLQVWQDNGKINVEGNACKRGEVYGVSEFTQPVRMVTSIARVAGKNRPLPVRLSKAVPKTAVPEILAEIARIVAPAEAKQYDVLLKDIAGTGADLIATADA